MRKLFLMAIMLACSAFVSHAGDKFVPKVLSERVADTWKTLSLNTQQLGTSLYFSDLFEFPDEIVEKLTEKKGQNGKLSLWQVKPEDLEEFGVKVELDTVATRDDFFQYAELTNSVRLVALVRKSYNDPGKEGDGTFTVKITYKGETVSNSLSMHLRYYISKDVVVDGDNEKATDIDFSFPDDATNGYDKTTKTVNGKKELTYKVELLEEPKYGTVSYEVKTYKNKLGNNTTANVMTYTPKPGTPNYVTDTLKLRKTILKEYDTKNLTADYQTDKLVIVNLHKNPYPTRIVEFMPAPGQFVNSAESFNYPGALALLGVNEKGEPVTPSSSAMISLGGFGGYIIFGFDQPITSDPRHPYGVDFSIVGNSFMPWEKGWWCEPASVQVMEDKNGDGIPNDGEWYELAGSDYWLSTTRRNISMTYYNPKYNSRYAVPYTTSDGKTGAVVTNNYHLQSYFPLPENYPGAERDQMTYHGSLIMCSPDKRVPSYIEFDRAPAFGYADNKGNYNKDNITAPLNPYYDDENGKSSDGFSLSWAVDKDSKYVDLKKADFVKVYTAGSINLGWLGEWSSEVCGIALTTPDEDYVPKDYYINYIGLNRVQVLKGESYNFEGFVFKNGRPVKEGTPRWWVDDESIATVDNNGKFTGVGIGKTKLHFQQYADAPEDVVTIEVAELKGVLIDLEGNASVVSNDKLTCVKGEKVYINVESITTCTDVMNGTMSNRYIFDTYHWTSTNPEVGTMTDGLFEAKKAGTTVLTVISDHNDSFTDKIEITVIDPDGVKLVSDKIKVPFNAPKSKVHIKEVVANDRGATVYLKSLKTITTEAPVTIDGDSIAYDYTDKEFRTDSIEIGVECYGEISTFKLPVIFFPDQMATPRQLLFASTGLTGNEVVKAGAENAASKTYIQNIGKAKSLVAEGAYAWVVGDKDITRYEVESGKVYSKATLDNSGDHKAIAFDDKILVSDGNKVRIFFKTDLKDTGKSIDLKETIKDFDVYNISSKNAYYDPSTLYALTGKDKLTLRKVSMKDMAVDEKTIALNYGKAKVVAGDDSKVFVVTAPDKVYKITYSGTAPDMEGAKDYEGELKFAAMPGASDAIYLVNPEGGLNVYNKGKDNFNPEPILKNEQPIKDVFVGIVHGAYSDSGVFYVLNGGETSYKEYTSKTTSGVSNLTATGNEALAAANYGLVTMQDAVAENDNPIAHDMEAITVHEYEKKTTYQSPKLNIKDFNDASAYNKSYKVYARNISDFPWITNLNLSAMSMSFSTQYPDRMDTVKTVQIEMEAIDNAGGSAKFNLPIKITPWLYKPHITPMTINLDSSNSAVDYSLDLGSIYMLADNPHLTLPSYKLTDNDQAPEGVEYNLAENNTSLLKIKAARGVNANFEIKVARVDHFIYDNDEILSYNIGPNDVPDKEYEVTVPVTITAKSGVEGFAGDNFNIVYDAYSKNIRCQAEGTMEVYSVDGSLVLKSYNRPSEGVYAGSLSEGVYVVCLGNVRAKILVK